MNLSDETKKQLAFIASEYGKSEEEVIADLIRTESHIMYYGYPPDERLPSTYAEIEYEDMNTPEAAAGCHFDDMNYLHYMER